MASRTLPGLGLKGDWALGEDNWKDENDRNLLILSVLVQGRVSNKLAAEPGAPAEGTIVILDETHATHANAIAVYDEAAWVYIPALEGMSLYNLNNDTRYRFNGATWVADAVALESLIVAVGDEATEIVAGVSQVTFRMPYAFTLTAVRASLTTASSAGNPTIDINEGGATILSTKITIDSGEKTSTTAAAAPVISDANLADDAEITIDIDNAGADATGLKVYLIGRRP